MVTYDFAKLAYGMGFFTKDNLALFVKLNWLTQSQIDTIMGVAETPSDAVKN